MPENEKEKCPCKRVKCPRYGDCKACLAHHKGKKYEASCIRLKRKGEKTENFAKMS